MNSIKTITPDNYPALLREIDGLPPVMYIRGTLPGNEYTYLTVVGSRRYSEYGKKVTEMLIEGLQGLPVVIVSGLALGIDGIAHRSALRVGLKTIAIPGSGLDDETLYPPSHKHLAESIIDAGGALLSPFEPKTGGESWMFPTRNRLMAGISHATLVIEAEIKSGTLITSKHATEFNRNVFTVPGSIFNSQSAGPHMLIRLGATPITSVSELIDALGFKHDTEQKERNYSNLSENEKQIIEVLQEPKTRDELFELLELEPSVINSTLSLLELKELVEESLGEIRRI